jgi:hypothetical protein
VAASLLRTRACPSGCSSSTSKISPISQFSTG